MAIKRNNQNTTETAQVEEEIDASKEEVSQDNFSTRFLSLKLQGDTFKDIDIVPTEFISLLKSWGFYRYDVGQDYKLVRISDRVISETTKNKIIDFFLHYINNNCPGHVKLEKRDMIFEVSRELITNKVIKGLGIYFSDLRVARLVPDQEIDFNCDRVDEAFFYYKNGFVKVTKEGYSLRPYSELKGCIWQNRILDREFSERSINYLAFENADINRLPSVFAKFIFRVCGSDWKRFFAFCSIIGYLLHDFFETKRKAIILTDSLISEKSEGRTGKTLFGKAIGKIRNYCEINGKNFDPTNKRKYETAEIDTQVIHVNDVMDYFDITSLFNDITEGAEVDKKNEKPFKIDVKFIISTNRTIKIEGSSAKDRTIEFEFANHYSDTFSPEDEFKHWFFRDWDEEQWETFDNFMMWCSHYYLRNGIVKADSINLEARKLLDHTSAEFVEFMRHKGIVFDQEYNIKDLFTEFTDQYEDFKKSRFTQKRFTSWLKVYTNLEKGYAKYDEQRDKRKSGANIFITFRRAGEIKNPITEKQESDDQPSPF